MNQNVYEPVEYGCVVYVLDMVAVVREVLRRGMSINLHMFHGGTNFGFMTGAVAKPSYKALITSYGLSSFYTLYFLYFTLSVKKTSLFCFQGYKQYTSKGTKGS